MLKYGLVGFLLVSGCGAANPTPHAPESHTPVPPTTTAQQQFERALEAFVKHDEANDWNPKACEDVAGMFDEAQRIQKGPFAPATFDAGLAWQRCKEDDKARAHFEQAAHDDPKFDPAAARLALYRFRAGNTDDAIDSLTKAVAAGEFKNPAALVDLAAMQMVRSSAKPGIGCKDDLDCAKLNLQRALALDDAYMPAMNQLGLYYLQLATKRAAGKKADVQQLELAALVCQQAIAKNEKYAPIHNTAGLVQHALGHESGAASEFETATKLDSGFYEARMNQAALNLSFRGFAKAESAYRQALALRPNDYDAHLGLALALRGPILGTDEKYPEKIAAVQSELNAAKKLDPQRPDAYFNEGILTQEFQAQPGTPTPQALEALARAKSAFEEFMKKAEGKAAYADSMKQAKERLDEIAIAVEFLKKT